MSKLATIVIAVAALAGAAQAQTANRTFVDTGGNDAGPCTRAQPCRTLAAGAAAVTTGGEVIVMDSGNFGMLTITRAVRITALPGVHAAVTDGEPRAERHHRQRGRR